MCLLQHLCVSGQPFLSIAAAGRTPGLRLDHVAAAGSGALRVALAAESAAGAGAGVGAKPCCLRWLATVLRWLSEDVPDALEGLPLRLVDGVADLAS